MAEPREVPGLLPHLMNCLRLIWSLSRFYNTRERAGEAERASPRGAREGRAPRWRSDRTGGGEYG